MSQLFKVLMGNSAQASEKPPQPRDDVPNPDPQKAKEFVKGMSEKPDYTDNLLRGLGIRK